MKREKGKSKMSVLNTSIKNLLNITLHNSRRLDSLRLKRAFTLVEIIIVVVILSIAAMAAIPLMSSASDVQIRSASNLIAADLEYAKSMAISRGQYYYAVFDASANSYQIEDQDHNVIQHPVKKGFLYEMDFANDKRLNKVDITSVSFTDGTVRFDCLGSPDSGGTITLNTNGIVVTITVEPVTGYISISN